MKKIMFNSKYGLDDAVLEGRKTMTRRIIPEKLFDRWVDYDDFCNSAYRNKELDMLFKFLLESF